MTEIFLENKKPLLAEMLGTFALVLLGAGAVIMDSHTGMSHFGLAEGKVGLLGIALAHGLTLMAMVFALGSISGGHFNPAVSLAFWIQKKLDDELFISYMLAQFAGAIIAALILAGLFPDEIALSGLGTPALAENISTLKGFFVEGLITFLLVITILFATRDDNPQSPFAAIAIGLTLTALILFSGLMTGGSANPARYLGPALVSLRLTEFFPYIAGEFLGGVLALFAFRYFQEEIGYPSTSNGGERKKNSKAARGGIAEDGIAGEFSLISDQKRVKKTYQLFDDGNKEEAVGELKLLLSEFNKFDAEVQSRILMLKIIFEEEMRSLDPLDTAYSTLPDVNSAGNSLH
mgnify:CR=1 FL=1|tara:strand:- start:417 stop:1460 length:1044 start_codon:yes stop_codon:yes gene_type:complete